MKNALAFMKTHAISLASGVASLVFIGLAFYFMSQNTVVAKMNKVIADTGASNISTLRSSAKNQQMIDHELARVKALKDEVQRTIDEARKINGRPVMMSDVFPAPKDETTRRKFVEQYALEFAKLPQPLEAGTAPTEEDLMEASIEVTELRQQEAEEEEQRRIDTTDAPKGDGRAPAAALPVADQPVAISPDGAIGDGGFGRGGGGVGRMTGGGPMGMASPGEPAKDPKYDFVLRARVKKARELRCYIDPFTFHQSPIVGLPNSTVSPPPPSPADMWYAQVGLWVQADVVRAIQELNDLAAANAVKADPSLEPFVEHVPVKRLISVRVHGYQLDKKMIEFPATVGTDSKDSMPLSFSDAKSNEHFDVIRFSVSVICDPREIQRLIDRIGRTNFYRCIDVDYDSVNRAAEEAAGYLYGTQPVVRANMAFEGFMSRDVYQPLMPKEVADAISGTAGAPQP